MQLAMWPTREAAAALVPPFRVYCHRIRQLSAETQTSLNALQEVLRVRRLQALVARPPCSVAEAGVE
jgi:hypothetical protein